MSVGTAKPVRDTIQKELDKRGVALSFEVISNPEFLKEGAAVADCMRPDRVIIGADSEDAVEVMRELYAPYVKSSGERFVVMDVASAEMTKFTANAMLATKISFMNEIAGICERVGADVNKVRIGIGSDSRIGYSFIYPGCGYGGSCFPKDVQALIRTSKKHGYEPGMLEAVEAVNRRQKRVLAEMIVQKFGEDLTVKIDEIGDFSITYDMQRVERRDYYNENAYAAYNYEDRPWIRIENQRASNETKILLIKDSFANCVSLFLSLQCRHMDVVDLRHFTGSIKNFVAATNPDIVIVLYHNGSLSEEFNKDKTKKYIFH